MIHDRPGHGRLMMHLVAIIADGAASQHITHAMSGKPSLAVLPDCHWSSPLVPTNQKRGLKAGESGCPGRTKAYCPGFWQYLLNNWSIVENNSLYEALPWVVANGQKLLQGPKWRQQSGKCLICHQPASSWQLATAVSWQNFVIKV